MLSLSLAALLVSCPTLPGESLDLVPDSATAIVGADVDRIVGTALGRALVHGLEADLDAGEALAILDECGVALDRVDEVWLARDAGEGRLLFARAEALAQPETLTCIAGELRARDRGREPWTHLGSGEVDDCITLAPSGGDSRAWISGDTLIWARGSMVEAIEQPGRPSRLVAAIDRSAHAWIAATLDAPSWAIEARSLVAAIELEREGRPGLWARFALGAEDVAAAATLRDRTLALIARFADHLDALGVEHRLRERAGVGMREGSVSGELELDARELEQIHAKLSGAGLF
ncbi:hypothetical protein ACNOYE_38145 [Nannocystaceae bacterium ST9]